MIENANGIFNEDNDNDPDPNPETSPNVPIGKIKLELLKFLLASCDMISDRSDVTDVSLIGIITRSILSE